MNIILISPPAAGKGTQSKVLKEKFNIPILSTSSLIKNAIKDKIEGYQEIEKNMKKGKMINNNVTNHLMKIRLNSSDCHNGYILDGYPRNINQAEFYDKLGQKIDYVFYFDIDKEILKTRIVGRLICPNCGNVYNSNTEKKPIDDGICDFCKVSLIKRTDDTKEAFEERYNEYMKNTYPLIDYYRKKNLLYIIDSSKTAEDTFNQIEEIINGERYD